MVPVIKCRKTKDVFTLFELYNEVVFRFVNILHRNWVFPSFVKAIVTIDTWRTYFSTDSKTLFRLEISWKITRCLHFRAKIGATLITDTALT
jgi:hypothetical protein